MCFVRNGKLWTYCKFPHPRRYHCKFQNISSARNLCTNMRQDSYFSRKRQTYAGQRSYSGVARIYQRETTLAKFSILLLSFFFSHNTFHSNTKTLSLTFRTSSSLNHTYAPPFFVPDVEKKKKKKLHPLRSFAFPVRFLWLFFSPFYHYYFVLFFSLYFRRFRIFRHAGKKYVSRSHVRRFIEGLVFIY